MHLEYIGVSVCYASMAQDMELRRDSAEQTVRSIALPFHSRILSSRRTLLQERKKIIELELKLLQVDACAK